jgi:hypothetical protein
VLNEQLGRRCQPDATTRLHKKGHAHLGLEHRQLLGNGGRAVREGMSDSGNRAAELELTQEGESLEIEHVIVLYIQIISFS